VRDWTYSSAGASNGGHAQNGKEDETGGKAVQDATAAQGVVGKDGEEEEEEEAEEGESDDEAEEEDAAALRPANDQPRAPPRVKVTEEPSASSILDNFDF